MCKNTASPQSRPVHSISELILSVLLVLSILLVCAPSARGVCSEPWPKPNAEFFHSDLVITGIVLSQRTLHVEHGYLDSDDSDEIYYQIRVRQVFRGKVGQTVKVWSSVDSVGLYLDTGREYLLFAYQHPGHGTFRVSACGNSGKLEEAKETIRQIEAIPLAGNYGDIDGQIESYQSFAGDPSLLVVVKGREHNFVARPDERGTFHLRVPPGMYSVHVESAKYRSEPGAFTFDDPRGFFVHRGGAAAVSLYLSSKGA